MTSYNKNLFKSITSKYCECRIYYLLRLLGNVTQIISFSLQFTAVCHGYVDTNIKAIVRQIICLAYVAQ